MKSKFQWGIVLILAWLTAGCDPVVISGYMDVHSPMRIGNRGKKKSFVRLEADQSYSARFRFPEKNKVTLEITKRVNGKSKKHLLNINVPKGKELPKYFGDFNLGPKQSGLNHRLRGTVDTETTQSDLRWGTDTCTYQERVRVCEEVRDRPCAGLTGKARKRCRRQNAGSSRRRCRMEYETQFGTQDIEYYTEYTTRNVAAEFVKKGQVVATFEGSDTDSYDHVTYRGECH